MAILGGVMDVVTGGGNEGGIFGTIGKIASGDFNLGNLAGSIADMAGLGNVADIISAAASGDFGALANAGMGILANATLGPVLGPVVASAAQSLMNGGGLNMSQIGGLLQGAGLTPGSDVFDIASSVFSQVSNGELGTEQATNLLAGLAGVSPEVTDLLQSIAGGGLGGLLSGGLTGGFAGGPGAAGLFRS